MIVTGIGSRKVPLVKDNKGGASFAPFIVDPVITLCNVAATHNWKLRSGAAVGMDTIFETMWSTSKEIYLPFNGFNGREHGADGAILVDDPALVAESRRVISTIHPNFSKLKGAALQFHLRNYFQIMGTDGQLADLCVYYSPIDMNGDPVGGTRTAVMLSRRLNIPNYNMLITDERNALLTFLEDYN